MNTTVGVVVFSRMSSSRLPGKALRTFGDGPLIGWVLRRSAAIDAPVILATSDDPDDDMLAQFAARQGLPVFRGSLVDVLSRAVGACHQLGLSHMLRLCGDRPYFDVDEAKVAIQHARRDPAIDFISNRIDGKPAPGLTTELISTSALEKAAAATRCDQSREHITTFHYRNLSLFRSLSILDSPSWEELGAFAVDTADDLARLQPLSDWTPCIEFASVSAYLRAR